MSNSKLSLCTVTQPNPNEFVFARVLIDADQVTIMDGIDVQLVKDQVYFLPFDCIR